MTLKLSKLIVWFYIFHSCQNIILQYIIPIVGSMLTLHKLMQRNIMQNKAKLVTVMTLNYNNPFIWDSINSVLEQTYNLIQYVIVDDCSDHFDPVEISSYIDQHQKGNIVDKIIIKNLKNMGIPKSANIALDNAKGYYLINLAGDDVFYDNQTITEWVKHFEESDANIITAYRIAYDENLQKKLDILPSPKQVSLIKKSSSEELFELLTKENFIFGCTTARTKQCVETWGKYDERYQYIEDYPWNLKVLRQGEKIFFWDRIVIKYRTGGLSSPLQFNTRYAKDTKLIYENEIKPYTKHPIISFYYSKHWLIKRNIDKFWLPLRHKIKLNIFKMIKKAGIKK